MPRKPNVEDDGSVYPNWSRKRFNLHKFREVDLVHYPSFHFAISFCFFQLEALVGDDVSYEGCSYFLILLFPR
jgi:hypothetical protein